MSFATFNQSMFFENNSAKYRKNQYLNKICILWDDGGIENCLWKDGSLCFYH